MLRVFKLKENDPLLWTPKLKNFEVRIIYCRPPPLQGLVLKFNVQLLLLIILLNMHVMTELMSCCLQHKLYKMKVRLQLVKLFQLLVCSNDFFFCCFFLAHFIYLFFIIFFGHSTNTKITCIA